VISYASTVEGKVCGGCQNGADHLLLQQTKHSALACAVCHPGHGRLPAGIAMGPHSVTIHERYGGACGDCHSIAHDVQNKSRYILFLAAVMLIISLVAGLSAFT
jgi:hypothetical protein